VSGGSALSARWRASWRGKLLLLLSLLAAILLIVNWGIELHRDWDTIAQLLGPEGNHTYLPY
jgi:hypothetical protein